MHSQDVWRFIRDEGLPLTNNFVEQGLSMFKIKQKISGFLKTQHGADTIFKIRS